MIIAGIDPGLTGAIALVDTASGDAFVHDIPTLAVKGKQLYSPDLIAELMKEFAPTIDVAIIEHQQVMGIEGRVSAFTIGYGYAMWLSFLAAFGIRREIVKPADWKKCMLLGRDKTDSRLRAIELFPKLSTNLRLKKDHGRAEALLLAEYGKRLIAEGASTWANTGVEH